MLGAIIGDIVGSRWEFNPTNDYNFEWLSPANSYTDDTICTVAVADALLHDRERLRERLRVGAIAGMGEQSSGIFGESIHDWCNRYRHPMGGYGGRFAQWVASNEPKPYGSFGNGAAMRVSPVAHWYDYIDEVLDAAAGTALPTHNHDEGIKGAQTVALAIFRAVQFNKKCRQDAPMHIDEILQECVQFSGYDINMPKVSVLNRFDETCQGTVPVALKIISMATDFVDAVRMAVSLGADADTLGAIVGSIAEAIWGIPLQHRTEIEHYLPMDMIMVLKEFKVAKFGYDKRLIDTAYYRSDFSEAGWDEFEDDERKRYQMELERKNAERRRLMAERGRVRESW